MADTTDKRDARQRIRIGLTGLAGVLVLVLFAAAMLGLRSSDAVQLTANGSRVADTRTTKPEPSKDPLAELGVIPGGSGDPAPVPPAPASPRPTGTPPAPTPAR